MDLSVIDWSDIWIATWETLVMTGVSLFFTILLGLPLGILLFVTAKRQLLEQGLVYTVLSFVVNVLRSVPFLILLIVMIPVTVILIGTSLGVEGAIPPLVVGTAPFFARLVENVLREVDRGVIEACQAMGIRTSRIIFGALLPEALPGLIAAVTVTAITLMSYAAMSGVIGGGGLGDHGGAHVVELGEDVGGAVEVLQHHALAHQIVQIARGGLDPVHIRGADDDGLGQDEARPAGLAGVFARAGVGHAPTGPDRPSCRDSPAPSGTGARWPGRRRSAPAPRTGRRPRR